MNKLNHVGIITARIRHGIGSRKGLLAGAAHHTVCTGHTQIGCARAVVVNRKTMTRQVINRPRGGRCVVHAATAHRDVGQCACNLRTCGVLNGHLNRSGNALTSVMVNHFEGHAVIISARGPRNGRLHRVLHSAHRVMGYDYTTPSVSIIGCGSRSGALNIDNSCTRAQRIHIRDRSHRRGSDVDGLLLRRGASIAGDGNDHLFVALR